MSDKDKTSYTLFCKGSECSQIQQMKAKINSVDTRLDVIIGGIMTLLVTVLAGFLL